MQKRDKGSSEQYIRQLVNYYLITKDTYVKDGKNDKDIRNNWNHIQNDLLPVLVSKQKKSRAIVEGLYRAIIELYESMNISGKAEIVYPNIQVLKNRTYGIEGKKARLGVERIRDNYLKPMVKGMRKILIMNHIDNSSQVKTKTLEGADGRQEHTDNHSSLEAWLYINSMKKSQRIRFAYDEHRDMVNRLSKAQDEVSAMIQYFLKRDLLFHPLFDLRADEGNILLTNAIQHMKAATYPEFLKLELEVEQFRKIKHLEKEEIPSIPFATAILHDSTGVGEHMPTLSGLYMDAYKLMEGGEIDMREIKRLADKICQHSDKKPSPPRFKNNLGGNTMKAEIQKGKKTYSRYGKYTISHIYGLVISHFIRKIRLGDRKALKASVIMNDILIRETDVLLVDGFLPYGLLRIMAFQRADLGAMLEENQGKGKKEGGVEKGEKYDGEYSFEQTWDFVNKNLPYVHPRHQNSLRVLCRKYILFRYGRYERFKKLESEEKLNPIDGIDGLLSETINLAMAFVQGHHDASFENIRQRIGRRIGKLQTPDNKVHLTGYERFSGEMNELAKLDRRLAKEKFKDEKKGLLGAYETRLEKLQNTKNFMVLSPWIISIYSKKIEEIRSL